MVLVSLVEGLSFRVPGGEWGDTPVPLVPLVHPLNWVGDLLVYLIHSTVSVVGFDWEEETMLTLI